MIYTNKKAVTLIEVLISILIVSIIAGVVVTVYPLLFKGVNTSSSMSIALEAATGKIEELKAMGVYEIHNASHGYNIYDPNTDAPVINKFSVCSSCDCSLDQNIRDYDGCKYFVGQNDNYSGVFYLEDWQSDGSLMQIEAVVCFNSGFQVIGEDKNLNGVLDSGEDTNGDGKISSPVDIKTVIAGF
ncbi:MAG TPA: prepilin-type N-terminal cleavage/methylation domain-containing protein [bacterium]|nr:prepilin-type N-terminal cleavage/methylation domain-containing protein [bacterium]